MDPLHEEVVDLTRDLVRFDTQNAVGHHPGNETAVAQHLADYLGEAGIECELVAREEPDSRHRANLVARVPGTESGTAPSLAFVGHIDVVPVDARDWTHPPFEGVLSDDGYLWGRGVLDMKGEVAARAVAIKELVRSGWRPRGDLWLLAVADEEDGMADVGMRWLLEARPDIRPDLSINEGGGELFELTDGRRLVGLGIGEKGTYPVRVTALGEAGHGSTPTVGDNAVPHLGEVLARVGRGLPSPVPHPLVDQMLGVLLGDAYTPGDDLTSALAAAGALHPELEHLMPALAGTTMAPTMIGASDKRNVLPSKAWVELDCRILPGTTEADVEEAVRDRLVRGGESRLAFDLSWPEPLIPGNASPPDGPVVQAIREWVANEVADAELLPSLGTGFTDSSYLRAAAGTAAYGFSPNFTTPLDVLVAGYHNADERVHVDDLFASVRFHLHLAKALLS
jgi:acetylornithine deacetylase/succinyl-diaminopimelate desuccinylase-like protein